MLVLSRKKNEAMVIYLPDGRIIQIWVVEIRGDKVRLGTDAPKDIIVDRKEVYEKKERLAKADEKLFAKEVEKNVL